MAENDEPAPVKPAVPGSRWRILAHDDSRTVELQNEGVLDEVVVDDWLHLEQMTAREWCLRIGDARLWISVEETGVARVDAERGFYAEVHGTTTTRP